MKQGATYLLAIKLDANLEDIAEVIFTLQGDSAVQKRYPYDVSQKDGLFSIPLTQEDTMLLCKTYSRKIEIEAQINYTNLSVSKTSITEIFLRRSLATEIVDGNTPAGISATEVSLEVVGGVLVATVSPEYIKQSVDQYFEENPQLTEDIKASFDDTKQYVDEKAKQAADSANSARESQQASKTAKTAAETAQKKTETAASEVQSGKENALSEISQAKTDSVTEITSTANSGVQSVDTAKNAALTNIQNSADGYLQSISTSGQAQIEAIATAGESEIADIKAAVEKAVKDVSDTGTAYVDSINTAGQTQTKAVNDAGKAQTDSITTVGGAQVSAVNTAGETQLSSIETASTAAQTSIGTAKEDAVSAVQAEGETQVENIRQSAADYESLVIKETVSGENILIEDSAKWPLKGLKLFGKSTQDGTPSPKNPVPIVSAGDSGQIDVGVYGGNLLDFNVFSDKTDWHAAVDVEPDGTITITNLTDRTTPWIVKVELKLIIGLTYIVNAEYGSKGGLLNLDVVIGDERERVVVAKEPFVAEEGKAYHLKLYCSQKANVPVSIGESFTYKNVQLNIGNKLLPYEPYTRQSLPCPTPNGLPGIPVSSGGNYTDESGQQWVCDEVDFGRGVYVKRVLNVIATTCGSVRQYAGIKDTVVNFRSSNLYGTDFVRGVGLSTDFPWNDRVWYDDAIGFNVVEPTQKAVDFTLPYTLLGLTKEASDKECLVAAREYISENPLHFMIALAEPEEIPLTDSILTAYAALHTNYPTTTVLNDSGAGMEAEYVADTNNYIGKLLGAAEHRIAALETNAIGG